MVLHLQANHQEIFWKANELIHDMLFKTLRIAWRIHSWVVYTRIRQHVWDNFLEIFSCARIRPKGKRYAEPDKIILNRTKTIIHNTILPSDEINNWLDWKEGSQPISSRPVAASRFSNFKRCQILTCMLISGWSIYCVALEKQNKRKQAQRVKWITKALANALANALAKTDQLVDSSLSTRGQRVWWFAYLWAVLYIRQN